jgi:hypothetical protein
MNYYLSVGALFKNESHILKEWLDHYIYHGVEHFFLINDKSTDEFMQILDPYIKKNTVTLFQADCPYYYGRQKDLYNKYFTPILQETKWLIVCDLDEFIWSAHDKNIKNILKICENFSQIQIDSNIFGPNGKVSQPKYVVPHFIKRAALCENQGHRNYKYIINTSFQFSSLNVHHADYVDEINKKTFFRLDYATDREKPYFVLNHYITQSKEFWVNVKCTRGDSNNCIKRNLDQFNDFERESTEYDMRLFEQNKDLYPEDLQQL